MVIRPSETRLIHKPSNHLLLSVFIILALAFMLSGWTFYTAQVRSIRQRKFQELQAIATLKVNQITAWREDQLQHARLFSSNPFLSQAIADWVSHPHDRKYSEAIFSFIKSLVEQFQYQNLLLASSEGNLLYSIDPRVKRLDPEIRSLTVEALRQGKVIMGDMLRDPQSGKVILNIAVPVPQEQNDLPIALVFQVNPAQHLYPLIQSWPVPSQSFETLLVRREGADVLFLNTLRFNPVPPLTLRIPLTGTEIPAVQAVLGHSGTFEGLDYRGEQVLAVILPVPDSSWRMVAKVDTKEILGEIRFIGIVVLILVVLAVIMTIALGGVVYNIRQRQIYQNLFALEQERRDAQEEIRATLYSVGDAVISTNRAGIITRMNPMAEILTGWSEADARGKPLEQVFAIVHETTRQKAENPVERTLREGKVVGLANHTLLLNRQGKEIPIADSSAPILQPNGHISGVVLVFRDQTQERAAQRERALLYHALANSRNEIYLFDADTLKFRFVNDGAVRNLGYSLEQLREKTPLDLKPEFTEDKFRQMIQPLLKHEISALSFETMHRRANGSLYPVEVYLQLFEYEGDRVFLAVINDITERKNIEKELDDQRSRLIQAQAVAHLGNWELNLADNSVRASEEAFRIYGLDPASQTLSLAQIQQIPIPEDRPRLDAALQGLLLGTGDYDLEFRIRRANDGEVRIIHSRAQLTRDAQGNPLKVVGIIQDVTDIRQTELSLIESEQRYRALFHNNHAVMLLIHPQSGAIVDANPAASDFYGWTHEELLGMNIHQINTLPPEDIQKEMELARSQQRNYFVFQHRKKNGEVCDVEVFSGPVQLKGETYLYSIIHDITTRRQVEKMVIEQMAELRRWHNITSGREERILELKQEINDLLSKLGMPPRYQTTPQEDIHE
ncbi:MAG: PAS domain-containing protein [Chloroflexota bacterium]